MKKDKKIRSFARRLMRRIGLAQLIVMGLASWLIYEFAREFVKDEETRLYQSYLNASNQSINLMLSDVRVSTTNRVEEIQDHLGEPARLKEIMRRIVESNPCIRSCGLSFVADYYPKNSTWSRPYAIRPDSGSVEPRIVDKTSREYLSKEWFKEAVAADSAYWSKPFFDTTDSVTPLSAYMIPIHDKRGKIVAILGADIKLDFFSSHMMNGIDMNGDDVELYLNIDKAATTSSENDERNENGIDLWKDRQWRFVNYNFIIDGDGTFISHPNKNRILKENYFELAKETTDTIDDYIGRQMVAGKNGTYEDNKGNAASFVFLDSEDFSSYVFFQPIAHTNWSIGLVVPRLLIDGIAMSIGIVLLLLIGLGLLAGRIVGRIVIKRMMKPLTKLAGSANEVAKGNFLTPLPVIKHNDEIKLLRDSFEGMQHSLTDYVEELKSTTASKAAIENELKVAHDIQMSMLPKTFPPYHERHDIDIYGTLTPAKDVGGDLFDFFILDERLFFCIADVSGKGVPASLLMAVTRSLFRNISAHVSEPHHIVSTLNNAMTEGNETNMFVTLFVGVLELATGRLAYCNASHLAPLIVGESVSTLPCDPNIPIGVMDGWEYTLQETTLAPDSTIFLYTDGLNEAEDVSHAQFGEQRIIDIATSMKCTHTEQETFTHISPLTLVNAMLEAVRTFVGEAEQSDDLTMLAINYIKKNE